MSPPARRRTTGSRVGIIAGAREAARRSSPAAQSANRDRRRPRGSRGLRADGSPRARLRPRRPAAAGLGPGVLGRDREDGRAVSAIERARLGESSAMQEIIGTRRREQLLTAGGAAALAVMIVFMLVPLPRSRPRRARLPKRRRRRRERAPLSIAPPRASVKPTPPLTGAEPAPARSVGPAVTSSAPKPSAPGVDLAGIAALCSDLTRDRPACAARRARTGGVAAQCIGIGDLGRRSGWP